MQVDKLSVVIEGNTRPLSAAFKRAIGETRSFQSEIEKTGTSADKAATKGQSAFQRFTQAVRGARTEASKGADFKTRADTSWADRLKGVFSSLRGDASKGATFNLRADTGGLSGIREHISSLRSDADRGGIFRLLGDTSGASGIKSNIQDIRNDASRGATMPVDANTAGLAGASAEMSALKGQAASGATMNIGSSMPNYAETTGQLRYIDNYSRSLYGRKVPIYTTVIGSSEAYNNLSSLEKKALSMKSSSKSRIVFYADAETQPALTALYKLMGVQGLAIKTNAYLKKSQLAFATSTTMMAGMFTLLAGSIVPVLGGYAALGTAYAGALAGFGLMQGAIYVLTEGLYDGGVAMEALNAKASLVHEAFVQAFGPASLLVAEIGMSAMDVALTYMPALGSAATATGGALLYVFQQFFNYLNSAQGQSLILPFLSQIDDIMGPLAATVSNLGIAFLGALVPIMPYAVQLAQYIEGVARATAEWATSAEGQAKITEAIELAIPFFQALRDVALGVGDALVDFSFIAGGDLPGIIRIIGGAIEWVVRAFTALYDQVGPVGLIMAQLVSVFTVLGPVLLPLAARLWALYAPLLAMWALSFIAIDIIVNAPDIAAAFSSTYEESRAAGENVAVSFIDALSAGLDETLIGSIIGDAIDAGLAWWESTVEKVSLFDVLAGDATLQEGADAGGLGSQAILGLESALTSVTEWLRGQTPEITLMDVIMGDATMQESADSGGLAAQIITSLESAWTSVTEWLGSLVPDVTLMDVIMGNATMEEANDSGNLSTQIITSLESAWTSVTEWMDGLTPETSLMDVITGQGAAEDNPTLTWLEGIWTSATEWLSGLAPETSIWDVLTGQGEAEDNPTLTWLDGIWTSATEWLSGLVPEISLMDVLMGLGANEDQAAAITEHLNAIWEAIKTDVNDALTSLYNDYWLYYFGSSGVLTTAASDFFSSLYNDYFLYYLGSGGVVTTAVSDFFSVLYNDWWLYYLGSDGTLVTAVSDFFSVLYNDWWLYYFGTDGMLATAISDFFSYLYNDWWLYYFGTDGTLVTAVSDFFSYLYNDWWLYYFGTDGTLITAVTDFFSYLYNDWWLYYFGTDGMLATAIGDFFSYLYNDWWLYYLGTDGLLATAISDFFTYIYEDWWLYYLGSDGVLMTAAEDAWTAIKEGVSGFVEEFKTTLGEGIKSAVETALGWLKSLLEGAASVLSAIGADDTAAALTSAAGALPISGESAYYGAVTDEMARGGSRGGKGTPGKQSRIIEWNEQSNGREWWIATGDANQRKQRQYLAGAASDLGMGVVPMATGGYMGAPVWHMAIGGGTDLGPGGLGERAGGIAQEIMDAFGVWANTYTGDPSTGGEHGSLHGNVSTNTFDFWADSAFTPLDVATGDAILQYLYDNYGSELDTVIWNGIGEGPGGSFEDYGHGDHVHASIGGGGILGGAGALAAALLSKAKGLWDALMESIPVPDIGSGPLWDGIEEFAGTIPEQAWNFILSKVPRGTGSFSAGSLSGSMLEMAQQAIEWAGWPADELAALEQLWNNESGWDPYAQNPESGAYGIPQINPGSHGYPVELGDTAGQIKWGLDYIKERYGSPSAALDFWLANNWYARGGSTDDAMARGGLTSKGIHLSDSFTGSGSYFGQQIANTGRTQGNASFRIAPRQTNSVSQTFSRNVSKMSGSLGGSAVAPRGGRRNRGRGMGSGTRSGTTLSGGGSGGGSTFWNGSQFANTKNMQNREVRYFHQGGVVPGLGEVPGILQGGERVLPRSLNAGFERLASSIELWSAKGSGGGGSAGFDGSALASKIDQLIEAVERGNANPTPVDINNIDALKTVVAVGSFAMLKSEAGQDVLDEALAEGIRFVNELQTSGKPV